MIRLISFTSFLNVTHDCSFGEFINICFCQSSHETKRADSDFCRQRHPRGEKCPHDFRPSVAENRPSDLSL